MKIYTDAFPFATIPDRKPGDFFSRLVGINISRSKQGLVIEPIYLAPIRISRSGPMIFFDLAWKMPVGTLVVFPRPPFFMFVRSEEEHVE